MEMFKVEKNVPIKPHGNEGELSILITSLEVGDSFLAPVKTRQSVFQVASRINYKLKTRAEGEGKVRVWRIA
jgi:hypothetical protein